MVQNQISFVNRYRPQDTISHVDGLEVSEYMKKVIKRSTERKGVSRRSKRDAFDPALIKFSPSGYLDAIFENFEEKVDEYIKTNPHGLLDVKDREYTLSKVGQQAKQNLLNRARFRVLMNVKYMRSLIELWGYSHHRGKNGTTNRTMFG